jgi:hypothetical protein
MPPRWFAALTLVLVSACGPAGVVGQSSPDTSSPSTTEDTNVPFPVVEVDGSVVHDDKLPPLDERAKLLISSFPADPHPVDETGCVDITDERVRDLMEWSETFAWGGMCSHGWLTVIADDCGECEGVAFFHRISGQWKYATTCHNYQLSDWCRESGPPLDVMCALWSNDRVLGALPQTGCDASRQDIADAVSTTCDYWYEWDPNASIPYGNCVYGWRVKTYQERLSALGYVTATDGYFGAESALATLWYQRDNGMKLTASLHETVYEAVLGN